MKREGRYEAYYGDNWNQSYSFWHQIIDRSRIQIVFLALLLKSFSKKSIEILDLGCGAGDEIATALKSIKGKKIKIAANDISKEALALYLENNREHLKETILGKIEEVAGSIRKKFDIILFSHCLYGISMDGLFQKYFSLLKKDGQLVIFLDGKDCILPKIRDEFEELVFGEKLNENVGEDVIEELKGIGAEFESVFLDYNIYLEKLWRFYPDGIRKLLIPFAMRKKDMDKNHLTIIENFLQKNVVELKLKGKVAFITATKKED